MKSGALGLFAFFSILLSSELAYTQTPAAPIIAQPYAGETIVTGTGTPNATVAVAITPSGGGAAANYPAGGGTINVGADGTFQVALPSGSPLKLDDTVTVTITQSGNKASASMVVIRPSGLVALAVGGAVFSQQAGNFSQSAPFFGFVVGYRWHDAFGLGDTKTKHFNDMNIRFEGIFSLSPETACTVTQSSSSSSSSPSSGTTGNTSGCTSSASSSTTTLPSFSTFISSPKSFDMNVHWWWGYQLSQDFEFGPYLAEGLSAPLTSTVQNPPTPTTSAATTTPTITTSLLANSNAKPYSELGALGEFALGGEGPTPKLFMQTVAAYGNYEQLAHLSPLHNSRNRAIFKLTVFPTGLSLLFGKQVELAPMFGVDINYGYGGSIVRFYTGAALNLSPVQKFTAPSM